MRAWREIQNETQFQNGETVFPARLTISEDGTVTMFQWNEETEEFDRASLQTENRTEVKQRALYAFQDQIEEQGGIVVATDLVLVMLNGKPAVAQWHRDEWALTKIQDIISRNE